MCFQLNKRRLTVRSGCSEQMSNRIGNCHFSARLASCKRNQKNVLRHLKVGWHDCSLRMWHIFGEFGHEREHQIRHAPANDQRRHR